MPESSPPKKTNDNSPLPQGATLGVFGGGQLGRMFVQAAQQLGYRTHVFAPGGDSPAGVLADEQTVADYHDFRAVESFAQSVNAATLEFENVPVATVEAAGRHTSVFPGGDALFTVQDRAREKRFLVGAGVPCAEFAHVRTADELTAAMQSPGPPAVLKTTKFGYDGKGQVVIRDAGAGEDSWNYLGRHKCVMEKMIDFRREVSVLVARTQAGETAVCGPIENEHANHILDISTLPASCSDAVAEKAREIAQHVASELDVVGIICIEFFETQAGELLVNEIAPRPHNSGHLTIEASGASQFEQQARALAGLPLGDMTAPKPAVMVNLLGDLWENGEPHWERARAMPGVSLHLYGKHDAKPGRKMGHLTVVADTVEEARETALAARSAVIAG